MSEETRHWRSRCVAIKADDPATLANDLTVFAKDKWVIAWQIFPFEAVQHWVAFVTYKVQDEK